MAATLCLPPQTDFGLPDVTQSICRYLTPFHVAAACSRALRDALAEQAAEISELLCKLERCISTSYAPRLTFILLPVNVEKAAAAICPKGCCGSQAYARSETRFDKSWLDDMEWQCIGPLSRDLRDTLGELAEALPARVVEHTHLDVMSGDFGVGGAVETRSVHVLLPVGQKALELSYSVEITRW